MSTSPQSRSSEDGHARSHRLELAGPLSGIVAVIASQLIAIPRLRDLGEELAGEMPAFVNVLVDHGGTITTVAVLVATVGIVALKLARSQTVRSCISLVTSLILFLLFIWDMVVFWLIYVATADGIG